MSYIEDIMPDLISEYCDNEDELQDMTNDDIVSIIEDNSDLPEIISGICSYYYRYNKLSYKQRNTLETYALYNLNWR